MNQVVLIVEDEPDLAEVLRYSLEKEGYLTRVAANGQEAVADAGSHAAFSVPFGADAMILNKVLELLVPVFIVALPNKAI